VLATLAVLVLVAGSGCDLERARDVSRRYACERWVERAGLRHADLRAEGVTDSTAWSAVAALYGRAVERLDAGLMERDGADALRHDLGRLACRARLGGADARSRAGLHEPALRGFAEVLERAVSFEGARADAALGLAQAEDRAGHWSEAHAAYCRWLEGVRDGTWPLHRQGMDVPVYVSRRLRDRNARQARLEWVDLSARALDAAASRGELPRPARYTRFVVLLEAERWDEAYAALRRCRELHDPDGEDGGLVVAEASLLAGGLGRQRDALRLLAGLDAERSGFASQHRVAGWLLAAQIQARAGDLRAAQRDYARAAAEARSAAGRSEAALGLARIHTELGELDQARRYYSQLRQVWFATPAGLLAPVEEVRMLWRFASEAQARALLPVAMQHYRRIIQQFGTEMPAMLAAQYLSECMGLAGSWERGIAFLDSIAREFESDPRSGSLLVRAARLAAEKLSDGERAEALLEQLYARYPNSDVAVLARTLEDSLSQRVPSP
jgi:TolA-binding protein